MEQSSTESAVPSNADIKMVMDSIGQLTGSVQAIGSDLSKVADRVSALEALESPAQSASVSPARSASFLSSAQSASADVSFTLPDREEDEADDDMIERKGKSFKLSDRTTSFLSETFSTAATNTVRRQWRDRFGHPQSEVTSPPFMDKLVKSRLHPATKSRDRQLSKEQALLLDAAGPLTYVLEEAVRGTLTLDESIAACEQSLMFIGNASSHLNRERRKNAITCMNKALVDMADDDTIFKTAAPALFGDGFSKKAKERSDELKCLSQAANATKTDQRHQSSFFRQSRFRKQQLPEGRLLWSGQRQQAQLPQQAIHAVQPLQAGSIQPEQGLQTVMSHAIIPQNQIKCLSNYPMSSVVESLVRMGIKDLTQSVGAQSLIAGRITLFLDNWRVLTSDQWVLNCVQGYRIQFLGEPQQTTLPREIVFSEGEKQKISLEVIAMLNKQAITEVLGVERLGKEFVSQLFAVPKKDGAIRPIINLKALNHFVEVTHFKMEGIHMLKDLLRQGDFMTKVDLKDAYFMIPIAEDQRKFLRFAWQGRMYQFNCLPFGLSSAPWVFTKTSRAVILTLRTLGLRLIIYIDDILIMAETEDKAKDHTVGLIFLLENLGFIVNYQKSQLNPTREIDFLGFSINSESLTMKLPGNKLKKTRADAKKLRAQTNHPTIAVSRLLGKLNHAAQAIPPAPLFYRNLQSCLQKALEEGSQNYDYPCRLSHEALEELDWWINQLNEWNGRCLLTPKPDLIIETDASTIGWGASCQDVRTGGPWSPREQAMHINCLELLAAFLAVKAFVRTSQNVVVHLRMDNTTALTYINKFGGTVSPDLNRLTKEMWTWCMARQITLTASHLAGSMNVIADEESRVMKDRSDWMLNPAVFHQIQARMGPLEVDLFASRLTHQLPKYVSWRPDPDAIEVDALSLDWTKCHGYANPPWNLIGRVIALVRSQKAQVVLVAPVWPSQPWYPTLLEMLVRTPLLLPSRGLIQATHPVNQPEIIPRLAAWNISGESTPAKMFRMELQSSSSRHGDRNHPRHMTPCLGNGWAGAVNGIPIPFQVISQQ